MLTLGLPLGFAQAPSQSEIIDAPKPSVTELPFDGYVFDAGSAAIAAVTLKGTADADSSLQVRGFNNQGSTEWHDTTANSEGAWQVTFDVPQIGWDRWYTPQARYNAGGPFASGVALFGCGTVTGFLGQSEITYFHALGGTYNPQPYPALSNDNLTVLLQDNASGLITPRRITAVDSNTVNLGLVAIANALYHAGAARKFMFVDMNQPGTARTDLYDDNDTERLFSHFADMLALVRSAGSDMGLVIENWYNADSASMPTIGPAFAPAYFGQLWSGGAFTLGSKNPEDTIHPTVVYDHCLWDIEAPADQLGRGVFARNRTKLSMMGPMPFHNTPQSASMEWANFTGTGPRMVEPVRDIIKAFTEDPRVQTFCVGYGPSTHLADFGGGIHPLPNDPYGTVQFALSHLPPLLNWVGMNVGEPIANATAVAATGTYLDVTVGLPNGGDLTTLRSLGGIGAPQVAAPHAQPVMGFEIARAGGERRPVFPLGQAAYPATHRGTVEIVDTGSGDPRRAIVRITPQQPFGTGDQVSYLLGQASGHLLAPRDVNARVVLDMMIEHIPALYDTMATHPFRGVPVKPQTVLPTVILANPFIGRGAAFNGATNYASSDINIGATNAGLMSFWFRNRNSAWNAKSGNRICQFRVGSSTVLDVRFASVGRMSFQLDQLGGGSATFTTSTDTFTLNKWHHVVWAWNYLTSKYQIFVDGVALNTSGYSFGTGGFSLAGQALTRMGIGGTVTNGNQFIGDIGHFWFDTTQTLDMTVPAHRARFLNGIVPADVGPTGAVPTGTTPEFYYDGNGASWANLGTAGNATLTGGLTMSDTAPSL